MSEDTTTTTTTDTTKWYNKVGSFLKSKGAWIGGALVIVGGALEKATGWLDAITKSISGFFGG